MGISTIYNGFLVPFETLFLVKLILSRRLMMPLSHVAKTDLTSIPLFKDLSQSELEKLAPQLIPKQFPAGETIIYRGDPGYSMYILLEGSVAVTLTNDEGIEYTVAELGKGEVFGEMALLTGEPRSANVTCVTGITILEIAQDLLGEMIAASPELNRTLFKLLAKRLDAMGVQQRTQHLERQELIASLMTARSRPEWKCFPGTTKWATELNSTLKRLAAESFHLLIIGEPGTETKLAANLIHYYGGDIAGPLLYLDCGDPPPVQRERGSQSDVSNDALYREMAQADALFGHSSEDGRYGKGFRIGLLELAKGGVLLLDNLEQLAPRVQADLLNALSLDTQPKNNVRIIATCRTADTKNTLDPELIRIVASETLAIKPLRERKKDIPVLAALFTDEFNRKFGKKVERFSVEAMNMLVDHTWPLNSLELRQVVERAVAIARNEVIPAEQIFLNLPNFAMTGKFNLLRIPRLDTIIRHPLTPTVLRFVTVPFILFLTIYTLAGPEKQNTANLIVWAVWWPFLVLSVAFASRSWCAYCPLPVISDAVSSFRSRFAAVPRLLSKYGVWCGIIGFIIIVCIEHLTHMFTTPHATGILLTSILGGAIITTVAYGSRSWCKHLCPLGSMIGHTASLSILEVGSNPNVCSTQCQTLDCIKDNNCPMGLHPSSAALTRECVLCLACIKSCKQRSARLNLRLPWQQLIGRGKWEWSVSICSLLLVAAVLAIKIPELTFLQKLPARFETGLPTVLFESATLILIMSVFFMAVIFAAGFPFSKNWRKNLLISGYPYIFPAFAGLFNVYFFEFVNHGENLGIWALNNTGLDRFIPAPWVTPNLGTLQIIFPIVTIAGCVSALYLLKEIVKRESLPSFFFRANQLLILLVSMIFLSVFW
jgi:transcriptional regulator with AAA-type ATPase domain